MTKEIEVLHKRALEVTKLYLKSESDLIQILQEMDNKRGYLEFGVTSLYAYAYEILKLGENVAYNLITVSRKAKEVPQLMQALSEQTITVSKARKIASVLTLENQEHWLDLSSQLSSRELEKEVAKHNPQAVPVERVTYKTESRLELKVGISEELEQDLKRVKDLLSQKHQKPVSMEQALEEMAKLFLEKNDPVQKAQRAEKREQAKKVGPKVPATRHVTSSKRPAIAAGLRHKITLRDGMRCTHRDETGKRCQERRWLEIHHIRPRSQGGADTFENLTTLCAAHHHQVHRGQGDASKSGFELANSWAAAQNTVGMSKR